MFGRAHGGASASTESASNKMETTVSAAGQTANTVEDEGELAGVRAQEVGDTTKRRRWCWIASRALSTAQACKQGPVQSSLKSFG